MQKFISEYIKNEKSSLSSLDKNIIQNLIDELLLCLEKNKTIYVFGNGGSGSTASHLQGDFNKACFSKTNKRFNVKCLNDNIPTFMAIANDISYDEIFKHQLINRVKKDDLIIAISGSGNSNNVLNACYYAKEKKAKIISLTGYDGGKLKQISDININSNIDNMQISEDIHLMIEHLIISYLYSALGMRKYNE